jgi:hypothetical protein
VVTSKKYTSKNKRIKKNKSKNMAKFITGNSINNATNYNLFKKEISNQAPNVLDTTIMKEKYKGGCFLAASAKWAAVVSYASTTLIPISRGEGNEIYVYSGTIGREMHLTWYDESAVEEIPTVDSVGTGNINPVGGFTTKDALSAGGGGCACTWGEDDYGQYLKIYISSTYNPNAKYIRLGFVYGSTTKIDSMYVCNGPRNQSNGSSLYTLVSTNEELSFNLDDVISEAGEYTLVVNASASGYETSDYSNEVSYVKS